jgi:hypothetical protein
MPVTKQLMANGSFTVQLSDNTPGYVRDAVDIDSAAFSHVVVTPAWIDANITSASVLLSQSIYTGVVYANDDALTLSGHHVTSWLGDPNGIGDVNERTPAVLTKSFKQWFDYVIASQTALTTGTITNIVSGTTMAWDPQRLSPREFADKITLYFADATGNPSIEWKVGDNLGLSAGTTANLYNSDAPYALLTPLFDGPDSPYPGLQADLGFSDDVEDYADKELFYYAGGGGVAVNGTATTWTDGSATGVARKRRDTDTNITAANATHHATSLIAKYDQSRRQLKATSPRFAVMADIPCGGYVYALDQDKGIYDLTHVVFWRGSVVTPLAVRCVGIQMPLEQGMGVYLITGGSTVTDLSRWFVPESPGATLTLGALDRKL